MDDTTEPSLLSSVTSILRCLGNSDHEHAVKAAGELQQRINNLQASINTLPGIDLSEDQQKHLLSQKQATLRQKQIMINKHVEMTNEKLFVFTKDVQ